MLRAGCRAVWQARLHCGAACRCVHSHPAHPGRPCQRQDCFSADRSTAGWSAPGELGAAVSSACWWLSRPLAWSSGGRPRGKVHGAGALQALLVGGPGLVVVAGAGLDHLVVFQRVDPLHPPAPGGLRRRRCCCVVARRHADRPCISPGMGAVVPGRDGCPRPVFPGSRTPRPGGVRAALSAEPVGYAPYL